jgi:hypothetical protein
MLYGVGAGVFSKTVQAEFMVSAVLSQLSKSDCCIDMLVVVFVLMIIFVSMLSALPPAFICLDVWLEDI